ncbi:hypothetical protein OAD66_09870, partial [Bacteroidia bacterium]|nr:hypothetical protein [Bacteroidia bacterium]
LLIRQLSQYLGLETWKTKKAGLYTVCVTKKWDDISVSTHNQKVKDTDLIRIAQAIRKTATRWSSYIVGGKSLSRYTLKIDITLEK